MTDTDLTDFGGGSQPTPPRVRKRQSVHITVGGDPKHIGHLADVLSGDEDHTPLAYVTTRDSHQHRIRALDAYAVSNHAIDEIQRHAHRLGRDAPGVTRFFVHENDTGTVYEWPFADLASAEQVPDTFLETTADPQRYLETDSAQHVWEDHAPDDFYHPRGGRQGGDA